MDLSYKGIDLEKIKQVQKISFSNVGLVSEMVQLDLKRTFSLDDFKANDSVIDAVRLQIEAHQNKQREDTEMFIICEMAKLFLEEKQKQKNVLERLEEEHRKSEECPKFEKVFRQVAFEEAIKIVKEGMG